MKFSDHIVNVLNPVEAENMTEKSIPDNIFYKSFFQDALSRTYPQLAGFDESILDDSSNSCSFEGELQPNALSTINTSPVETKSNKPLSNQVTRPKQLKNSPTSSLLKEKAMEVIKSDPR